MTRSLKRIELKLKLEKISTKGINFRNVHFDKTDVYFACVLVLGINHKFKKENKILFHDVKI